MNDSTRIEELHQEVQRLRRSMIWISVVLGILILLYILTSLPVLITFLTDNPVFQLILIITIGSVVFVYALVEVYLGLGKPE